MMKMQVGDQTIRYDRKATVAAYAKIERGFAEKCGCVGCRNFIAQRDVAYPSSFRALLDELGIDPNKEGEAFDQGWAGDESHVYGGWFYFAGEMIAWGETVVAFNEFSYFVGRNGAAGPEFSGLQYLTIEFETPLKWVLAERPEYRPAARPQSNTDTKP